MMHFKLVLFVSSPIFFSSSRNSFISFILFYHILCVIFFLVLIWARALFLCNEFCFALHEYIWLDKWKCARLWLYELVLERQWYADNQYLLERFTWMSENFRCHQLSWSFSQSSFGLHIISINLMRSLKFVVPFYGSVFYVAATRTFSAQFFCHHLILSLCRPVCRESSKQFIISVSLLIERFQPPARKKNKTKLLARHLLTGRTQQRDESIWREDAKEDKRW